VFEIYPAIDLRGGKVVRLQEGDPNRQTVFADDPRAAAERWIMQGARWLHVVNLDGAFGESKTIPGVLETLCQLGARVQFGGGVRSLDDIRAILARGVARVVLGTLAVEQPEIIQQAITQFGADKIVVGIDARAGHARVRGWQSDAGLGVEELARHIRALGVERIVYTQIERDGMLSGANVQAAAHLAQLSGLHVIVAGGVANLEDIRRARALAARGLEGVIVGRALYEGAVDLCAALRIAESDPRIPRGLAVFTNEKRH
jgi:phosphoribosylformimino-5-aminoimidazole carboxamide ribotide isomerase